MLVSEFIGRCLQDVEGSAVQCSNSHSVPYLKDWHFVKEYPEYVAYKTPIFFCDDWLNLYLDNYRMHTDSDKYQENNEICCSDYRFVYMGVKGSWTPLHADVFRSYSWSANVCGKKRWLFLDPSQHHLVFDRNMKNCVYNIFDEVSDSKFPGFKKAIWLECMQEAGEIIFVPSGWYHQVQNLVYTGKELEKRLFIVILNTISNTNKGNSISSHQFLGLMQVSTRKEREAVLDMLP
ncbi:hypothetical protein S83_027215 [Arachis hypogaea]